MISDSVSVVDRNGLEPAASIELFNEHPPTNFKVWRNSTGASGFTTDFNLLTTAPDLLKKVRRMPVGSKALEKMLTWRTAFFGSPASEFTRIPCDVTAASLVSSILVGKGKSHRLTIIKDLPCNSPLLSNEDNAWVDSLVSACEAKRFVMVEGMALAYVPIDFDCEANYLERLSKSRRKNIRRKLRSRDELTIKYRRCGETYFDSPDVRDTYYTLYLAVYAQSETHFELLTPVFFDAFLTRDISESIIVEYWHDAELIGFNICFLHGGNLIDKYIGLKYPDARDMNLYFVSWMTNLEISRSAGCKYYISGWTDPEVKSSLGARFTKTRHAVYTRHTPIRALLRRFVGSFEMDKAFQSDNQ